ncbi:MAG: antitoxin family protein [Bacteroidota bacterium]
MTIYATYDGAVLRPDEPLDLAEGERVRLTVEDPEPAPAEPYSAFRIMESLDLDGPPDWSENINEYVTGERKLDG